MNGSFKLGTAFRIPIYLHWSFLFLAMILVMASPGMILVLPVLAACVLLHELGHGLAAQHFRIRVMDITLLPIGGMARMAAMPEDSRVEGIVAIAGPAVNFLLAFLGYLVVLLGHSMGSGPVASYAALFVTVNLVLGLFNLIPAFPMDGGRILRAFLARRGDWVAATEGAVRVGRWVALAMFLGPLVLPALRPQLPTLPLIALFVWFAGGKELIGVRLRHGLAPIKGIRLGVNFPGGPAQPGGPGGPGGFSSEGHSNHFPKQPSDFETQAEGGQPTQAGSEIEIEVPQGTQRGFDEDEIKALERFHGRIRRTEPDA